MPGIGEIAVSLLAGLGQGELQRQQTKRMMDRQSKQDALAEEDRTLQRTSIYTRILEAAQRSKNPEMYKYAANQLEPLTGQQFNYQEPQQPTLYDVPEQYQDVYGNKPVTLDQLTDIRRTETAAEREKRMGQPKPKPEPKETADKAAKFQLQTLENQMRQAQENNDIYLYDQLMQAYLQVGNSGKALDAKQFNAIMAKKGKADVRALLRKQGINIPEPGTGATKQQKNTNNDPLGLFK